MRNPGGYGVMVDKLTGKVLKEEDSFTCGHCGAVRFVKPKERPEDLGGYCTMCDDHICAECHHAGGCTPFEKKLEILESPKTLRAIATQSDIERALERQRLRRSYGL